MTRRMTRMSDDNGAAYWFEQSLLHYFDHRMAEHMLWGATKNMGVTSGECTRYARQETIHHFCINCVNWTEQQINNTIDNYMRR